MWTPTPTQSFTDEQVAAAAEEMRREMEAAHLAEMNRSRAAFGLSPLESHKPTTRAATSRAARPGRNEGLILGKVLEYATISKPIGRPRYVLPGSLNLRCRVFMRLGCFDRWLAEVAAGRKEILLCLGHDVSRPLCSTREGSLNVWSDAEDMELLFSVAPSSEAGRSAIRTARQKPTFRKVSAGFIADCYELEGEPDDPHALMVITQARLEEVSLVPRALFPHTRAVVY
jgi:hypothetical protein